jgi:hypothetical protein
MEVLLLQNELAYEFSPASEEFNEIDDVLNELM